MPDPFRDRHLDWKKDNLTGPFVVAETDGPGAGTTGAGYNSGYFPFQTVQPARTFFSRSLHLSLTLVKVSVSPLRWNL